MSGFGWCNPAFYGQDPISNEEYLATLPESDPWFEPLKAGFARLDAEFPGWKVAQIKEKFWECRFYAAPPKGLEDRKPFWDACREIEVACDATSKYGQRK